MPCASTILVLILLGLALVPGSAIGAQPCPGGAGTGPDSSFVPAPNPGGYVFPSGSTQLRSWAMNVAGPSAVAGNLVGASWRQWVTEQPVEWGNQGVGFARRLGTGSLATAISESSRSLVSAAMRQDAGYYRSPRSGLIPRLGHAVVMTFVARNREGRAVLSPGKTFSPFVGPVVVQTTLYPDRYSTADGLRSGAYGLLGNAGLNVAREFILRAPNWEGGR